MFLCWGGSGYYIAMYDERTYLCPFAAFDERCLVCVVSYSVPLSRNGCDEPDVARDVIRGRRSLLSRSETGIY